MSTFTGPQHPGAAREHHTRKVVDAKVRQLRHEQLVVAYEVERGVDEAEARRAVRMVKTIDHWFGDGSVVGFRPGGGVMTVVEALAAVMADVRAVGKGDYNDEAGFAFRGIDAIVNAVAPALRTHGVVVVPTVKRVKVESVNLGEHRAAFPHTLVTVRYRWYGPDGDHIDCTVVGEAIDTGDKAVSKAMSVAWRIALLQTLALPTNEPDPDATMYTRSGRTDADDARDEVSAWVIAEGIEPQAALEKFAEDHDGQHISASTDADEIRAWRDAWAAGRDDAS